MALGDKYQAADTNYDNGENAAEYDGYEYNFQIVDLSDDIVCLCPTAEIRDKLLALLNKRTDLDEKIKAFEEKTKAFEEQGHDDQEPQKNK